MKLWKTAAAAVPLAALTVLVPVQADASTTAASSAPRCHYNVVHVKRGHYLAVRRHPRLHSKRVNRLHYNARHVLGGCKKVQEPHSKRHWVHVHPKKGKQAVNNRSGYSLSHYLHKVR
ncbi:hypothetical protein DZF91_30650 [Actinomadura logoneensis]|uniref:SH3 domain-containing protein n=1 Tax=Actinomadura logoneensis TaxID=2293572 RepID=A0A372JDG3_9ACTN|nr:hypothetical protein [Actinomadura logoneensis]RFU37874.1 hypothetical protein DZF91_30650 [Actinomadura logoneensis]